MRLRQCLLSEALQRHAPRRLASQYRSSRGRRGVVASWFYGGGNYSDAGEAACSMRAAMYTAVAARILCHWQIAGAAGAWIGKPLMLLSKIGFTDYDIAKSDKRSSLAKR